LSPGEESDVNLGCAPQARRARGARRRLLMFSRRNFPAGAGDFLLPRLARKRADSKPASALSPIHFRELAQRSGLDFILQNNPTPRRHVIETMPGDVAAFDYNHDGRVDIFLNERGVDSEPGERFAKVLQPLVSKRWWDEIHRRYLAGGRRASGLFDGGRQRTMTTTAIPMCLWRASTATFFTATWVTESSKTLQRKRESKAISGPRQAGWFDYLRAGGT
jgi:hypothetical protein